MILNVLMTEYLYLAIAAGSPILFLTLIVSLTDPNEDARKVVVLLLGICLVGAVAGLNGGLSRVGVVGDIVPAALALVGGVAVYVFGVDQKRGLIASVCAAGLALSLGGGYAIGSQIRSQNDAISFGAEFCREIFAAPDIYKGQATYGRAVASFGTPCSQFIGEALNGAIIAGESGSFSPQIAEGFINALTLNEFD